MKTLITQSHETFTRKKIYSLINKWSALTWKKEFTQLFLVNLPLISANVYYREPTRHSWQQAPLKEEEKIRQFSKKLKKNFFL